MPAVNAEHLDHSDADPERRALHAVDRLDRVSRDTPLPGSNRLSEVVTLFGDELSQVNRRLEQYMRDGLSPAVDSATHLFAAGGKRVRPLMVILSAACFGPIPPSAIDVAVVAELVHLATLLHDDVVDDGKERRGRPASRCIWGNAVSVLAGDSLLTHALEITRMKAPAFVLADLLGTLRRLVEGEVTQLASRTNVITNEEIYLRVARDKTASLFEWAARSGAVCANASSDATAAIGAFGGHLGLAFQLVDDVLDYAGDSRSVGKSLLADLVEGKMTLPLIRAVSSHPELVEDIESIRAGDGRATSRVAAAVRSSGACTGVRALAQEETRRAAAALEALPASRAREILETVAHDLADRIT